MNHQPDNYDLEQQDNSSSTHSEQQQQQQQQKQQTPRETALAEANAVLSSPSWQQHNLEQFNLLSVVTSPRADLSRITSSSHNHPHSHNIPSSSTHSDSSFDWNVRDLTLENITATVNDWTHYLEEFSSNLFEGDGESQEQELPYSQLEVLPERYNVDLGKLERWFRKNGQLSEGFETRKDALEEEMREHVSPEDLEQVPELFLDPYFDLTDPKTFEKILGLCSSSSSNSCGSEDATTAAGKQQKGAAKYKDAAMSKKLIPPNYDSLSSHLDLVEISLLHQVKTKSSHFFRETDNFQILKDLIHTSLAEVQTLRQTLSDVKTRNVLIVDDIPIMARKREDLVCLKETLEKTESILSAKTGVGGWIAGEEYFTALEAIHQSRALLRDEGLGKLDCLSQVEDQLSDYETLIVDKWSEELVGLFMNWEEEEEFSPQSKIREILRGLQKCDRFKHAHDLYETRLCDLIKVTVKTTVCECANDALTNGNQKPKSNRQATTSITDGVTSMTFNQFLSCLDMLFDQLLVQLKGAVGVNTFLKEEGIILTDEKNNTSSPSSSSAELVHKSISELLRLRKDAHSLISLDEMKRLWDTCLAFTLQLEKMCNFKAYGLRSTLLAQAKGFLERTHESNMAQLVASLDSEKWMQVDVSPERQAALTRLTSGRAVLSSSTSAALKSPPPTSLTPSNKNHLRPAIIDDTPYKTVWSNLLLVEMLLTNISCAAHFQTLATSVVNKISELLRLFNSRTTQLVLGAGAIHSAARLKSINAKHLALVTQCLGLLLNILPHIRAALMAQLPSKQHSLLNDLDKIQKDIHEHNEKVLSKFVSIIGGIVEHGLAPRIPKSDFDSRGKMFSSEKTTLCSFLDGVSVNVKKMHQVLKMLLPEEHLRDVFSRIFAYVDQKVVSLFVSASEKNNGTGFEFPKTIEGKKRMILEVECLCNGLKEMDHLVEWDFTAYTVLERRLGVELRPREPSYKANGGTDSLNDHDKISHDVDDKNEGKTKQGTEENGHTSQDRDNNDCAATEKKNPSQTDETGNEQ